MRYAALGIPISVKDYSNADAEIVLRAVKQSCWVVVNLDDPNINSIACANVDTAAYRAGQPCFAGREISGTWAWYDGDTKVVAEVYAITRVRSADERMSEWLERFFGRVVFELDPAEKVKDARINVYGVGGCSKGNVLLLKCPEKSNFRPT